MDFPPFDTMSLLLALEVGERLAVSPDGRLTITIPTRPEPVPIASLADALNSLEIRGWVVVAADGESVVVTEQGRYAVKRWLTKMMGGSGRLVRNVHWVETRVTQ